MSVPSLLHLIALQYKQLGDPLRSIQLFREALEYERAFGNKRAQGYTLWDIANALHELGEIPSEIGRAHV